MTKPSVMTAAPRQKVGQAKMRFSGDPDEILQKSSGLYLGEKIEEAKMRFLQDPDEVLEKMLVLFLDGRQKAHFLANPEEVDGAS